MNAQVLSNTEDGTWRTVVVGIDEPAAGWQEYAATVALADLAGKTATQKFAIIKAALVAVRSERLGRVQQTQSDLPATVDLP